MLHVMKLSSKILIFHQSADTILNPSKPFSSLILVLTHYWCRLDQPEYQSFWILALNFYGLLHLLISFVSYFPSSLSQFTHFCQTLHFVFKKLRINFWWHDFEFHSRLHWESQNHLLAFNLKCLCIISQITPF